MVPAYNPSESRQIRIFISSGVLELAAQALLFLVQRHGRLQPAQIPQDHRLVALSQEMLVAAEDAMVG